MYMVMVVIAGCRDFTRLIGANLCVNLCVNLGVDGGVVIVGTVVTMLVAVMPEMCGMASRMFQRAANTRICHIRGIQREHDGKKKRETGTHKFR